MSDLQLFQNPEFGRVRIVEVNGEAWMVGKDVAEALGYSNPQKAIRDHVDEDDKGVNEMFTPGGKQAVPIINESGLYSLVLSSKLPNARKFRRWVTNEVLPTVRKHGAYMTPETLQAAILNPDTMIQLCQQLKAEQEHSRRLEAENAALVVENQIAAPKAEYFDALVDRNLLTNFRQTAKELGVKERDFVSFLLSHKYLYRDRSGKLLPYASKNDGLFEIKECFNDKSGWKGTQTLITPKGRETFRLLCVGSG